MKCKFKNLFIAALIMAAGACFAQSYPVKPVRLVVPFPPGGAVDLIARLMQPGMAAALGQPFLIENRPGAAGNVGVESVARSAPDGYTLVVNTNGQAISPAMYKKLSWDPARDFLPLSQLVASHLIVIASPRMPASNLAEFIALAKARPGVLNYGGTGIGNPLHLTMELIKLTAGIDVVAVHYQGDAPLYTAMMAGQVEVAVVPIKVLYEADLARFVRIVRDAKIPLQD